MEKSELFLAISIIVFAGCAIEYIKYEPGPVVKFSSGTVQGTYGLSSDTSRKYKAFYGIPYAKPPLGNLRFEPPQPIDSWSEVKDASRFGAQCLQTEILFSGLVYGSEDCLFVNVFVPFTKTDNKKLPVLAFIHGGYWHLGSSEDHGERRFMEKDVVLVTLNYRLGALGFLSTGDADGIRGNMGLKDQVLALKWIQKNIEYFGGDPTQVTIFGESVGAASVHLHMISPMSKGLFHRGISQSGTALNVFATYRKANAQAKRFANKLNCPTDKQAEMIKCLRNVDAHTLVSVHKEALDVLKHKETLFAPTVEAVDDPTSFLVEEPLETLLKGNMQKIPWITGVNAHEGRVTAAALSVNEEKEKVVRDYKSGLPKLLQYSPNDEVTEKVYTAYITPNVSKDEYIMNITNLISDRVFFHPLVQSATLHAKYAPTYLYLFHHHVYTSLDFFFYDSQDYYVHPALNMLTQHFWRFLKEFVFRSPVVSPFVCHGDELPLLFTHPWTPSFMSWLPKRDLPFSRTFIDLWTSFASDRTLTVNNVEWEPISTQSHNNLRFLNISAQPAMIDSPFKDRIKFWDTIKLEDQ